MPIYMPKKKWNPNVFDLLESAPSVGCLRHSRRKQQQRHFSVNPEVPLLP